MVKKAMCVSTHTHIYAHTTNTVIKQMWQYDNNWKNLGNGVIFVGLTLLKLKYVLKRLIVHNQMSFLILGDFLKEKFILMIY